MGNRFRFFRAGGVDQVELKTGADLVALSQLNQELWVALSCPVAGLEFDDRTLALIDTDKDGRVRAPELLRAISWTRSVLSDIEELSVPHQALQLSSINVDEAEGKLIEKTVRALLKSIGKGTSSTLSFDELSEALDKFNHQTENGDGVVPAETTDDESLKTAISVILTGIVEPNQDRSGHPGVTKEQVEAFFAALRARRDWLAQALNEGRDVLGPETLSKITTFFAVSAKIDDFYARVRAVSFDGRALDAMNREQTAYLSIGQQVLDARAKEFEDFPLAHVAAGATLPLGSGLNPAWMDRIYAFEENIVHPLLGREDYLTEQDYRDLVTKLTPQLDYQKQKPTSTWDGVHLADVAAWLDTDVQQRLLDLVAADSEAADTAGAIELVEKLVRFKRGLLRLANNFVAFRDFYEPGQVAIFQIGSLYIDQRVLRLVVRVNDPTRHIALGPLAATYLLYCDVKNAKGEKMSIVAAVTDGDVDHLSVGRNAIFYDRRGGDWDATVTRIVEQPISLRQAFWAPYKKFVRLIEDQINKRAAAAEAESNAGVEAQAASADAISKGDVKKPAPAPKKMDIGVVAALGVAVGGITAALGVFLDAFLGLGPWIPLGILGLILIISLPSVAVAGLKLRRRNIGPLLDANGWAINVLPRVNMRLGQTFTTLARLPEGSARNLRDPFADEKPVWKPLFVLVLIATGLLWYLGKIDRHLPKNYRSTEVLGEAAPAHVTAKPAEIPATTPPAAAPVP